MHSSYNLFGGRGGGGGRRGACSLVTSVLFYTCRFMSVQAGLRSVPGLDPPLRQYNTPRSSDHALHGPGAVSCRVHLWQRHHERGG